jgi:hypothetical protein
MNAKTQRLCVWCGPAMIAAWMIGFWTFAGFVPPPAPGLSKEQVADLFREHGFAIRLGLVLTCFGSALLGPFVGVLSVQLRRIEGPHSPLANSQMVLGAAMPLIFIFPVVILQVAAYRPERSAEAIQLLYDLGWILFIAVVTTVVVQLLVTAIAILGDSRTAPVFPRWLPLSSFALWFGVMTWLLLRAIREQERVALSTEIIGSADDRIERLESELGRLRSELAGLADSAR